MAKSVRAQRLRAIDDLRDMADAMEQAAELFEETLGDLDAVSGGQVKRTGKNATYEEISDALKVYRHIAPMGLKKAVADHVAFADCTVPDCEICAVLGGEQAKGWLSEFYVKVTRREVKRMLEEGDEEMLAFVRDIAEDEIRNNERGRLKADGRLVSPGRAALTGEQDHA